jgi:hypothetical protein
MTFLAIILERLMQHIPDYGAVIAAMGIMAGQAILFNLDGKFLMTLLNIRFTVARPAELCRFRAKQLIVICLVRPMTDITLPFVKRRMIILKLLF